MKVKVGNRIHDAHNEMVMVILNRQDKENIANMSPENTKYAAFPIDTPLEEVERFMDTPICDEPFFIFDVESVGIHGEGFAVAGGVYVKGRPVPESEFVFNCHHVIANGFGNDLEDREWLKNNLPPLPRTHLSVEGVRSAFWSEWEKARERYPSIKMAAECPWPVESSFLSECIKQGGDKRKWDGPYPLYDVSSIMLAAGMDPMKTHERKPSLETPAHHPLADTRLSARLLYEALRTNDS